MVRGFESDPSKILLDHYTEDQVRAQSIIDQKLKKFSQPNGELLVIIPFKDRWDLTSQCLNTLNEQAIPDQCSMIVVLVDNGSIKLETIQGIASSSETYPNLKIETISAKYPFNFSRLNNDAFKKFRSNATKWVLFLNNDVALNDQGIIARMVSCLESIPEAGCVGCTLLYPEGRIQHLFAAPGVKIIAAHPLKGVPYSREISWFEKAARPVAAVTGAVMMIRAADFEAVGQFDETLPTMGQDIVLSCVVSDKLSKFNVSLQTSEVIHQESPTKSVMFSKEELHYVYLRYGKYLYSKKYFSRNLSRWSEQPVQVIVTEPPYPAGWVI